MELTPAANVTLAAPTSTSAAAASGRVGAAAARRMKIPKAALDPINRRGDARPRAPVTSAPTIDPAPMALTSAAYDWGPPSNVNRASSGRRTWKLKASVLTSAIIASGMASAGVAATYRIAARRAPGSRPDGRGVVSCPGSICRSAITITG